MSEASARSLRASQQLKSLLYTATTNEALALRLRALLTSMKGTAPSPDVLAPVPVPVPTATLIKNTAANGCNDDDSKSQSHNLMTPPNGTVTPTIGVPSPTVSIKNPTTLSGGSSQDLHQQEEKLGRRPLPLRNASGVAALLAEEGTTAHPELAAAATDNTTTVDSQQPALTSRIAIIAAAGVSLGGRTSSQGGPSKYRGVVWHKSNSKWEARIYEAGKQRFLGYFSIEDEAALTYDDYAARIHGTSAKLNFPDTYAGVVLPKPTHAVHAVRHGRQHSPGPRHVAAAASRPRAAITTAAGKASPTEQRDTLTHTRVPSSQGHHQAHPHPPRRSGNGGGNGGGMRVQPVKGSSSFRGVSWNSNCSKWRAQVWKGSEVHHLGYFEHEEDAAHAYDEAVLRIRGPDAPTNYPRSHYGVYFEDDEEEQHAATSNSGQFGVHSSSYRNGATAKTTDAIAAADKNDISKDGDSNMLGVSWSDYHNAWVAEIWDGKKYQLLGAFRTEADAAKAYDVACLAQQGSDALTNFSLENYPTESAAVALLGLAHDYSGYEQLYGTSAASGSDSDGEAKTAKRKRSATPPTTTAFASQYHSSSDLTALDTTHKAKKQVIVIHNKRANSGGAVAKRAVTPLVETRREVDDGAGSLSFPTVVPPQHQYNGIQGEVWAPQTEQPTTASAAAAAPVVSVEEYRTMFGQLQNFIAHQQQQQQGQLLPVLPLQSSAPVALSEQAQNALMTVMQAALARQQEATAAGAAAAAAQASWEEQYASHQQRLVLAAAVQKWALAKKQQQQQQLQQVAPLSNFLKSENGTSPDAMAAAYRAALLSHQMKAAAKRPRV